ncbi:MAG: long-chain fatty acid--CoA ligase [Flavobacteriaceae bacterium]|jgi:long-chain acyl-CoA synthetase|nr:long-chain fatty acid--CoA ligase [Flavobacteriaceae bacterium]
MEVTRLFDILDNYLEKYPNQDAALACKRNKQWVRFSIQEYVEMTNDLSYGLLALGIQPKDKVGIVGSNHPEWNMLDFAVMQIGAISVPVYPTISQEDYKHILNHTEMNMIVFEGRALSQKLKPIFGEMKNLREIYTFFEQGDEYKTLQHIMDLGRQNPQPEKLKELKNAIKGGDMATIIYTSGTTGLPKGVMLSHSNILGNVKTLAYIPLDWNVTALSFLPLCHAYERMLVYLYQYRGMSVYYAENLGTIAENIKEINPNMMTCVPRLLEKIYDKLYVAGKDISFPQKQLYYWAFYLATKYKLENRSCWYKLQHKIADKLVYSKWRKAIGGNFDVVVSGGSAIQLHIAAFFTGIGMNIFEGYGLSETSPVIAVTQRIENGWKLGTVGLPLPGTEVRITNEGEIACRGHNVMLGYYKAPELTAQVIDKDGWFHTGDLGEFTPQGQLKITGRLKSLFKTSFGKYVNPELIENKFSESLFIETVVVLGENRQFAAALIVPDFEYLQSWCKNRNIPFTSREEVIEQPEVVKLYKKIVKTQNESFADYEKVKRYHLISDEWTVENGIMSPTLKVKRKVIEKRYADIINHLFNK